MNYRWLALFAVCLASPGHAEDQRYVAASSVNVREQPTVDAKVLVRLPIATSVAIKTTNKEWALVDVQSGVHKGHQGWIAVEFLISERPTLESLLSNIDQAPENDFRTREKWAERATALDEFVGEFSNIGESDVTGDCSGYKVWIWKVDGKIVGRFRMLAGDCGDSLDNRNALSNVTFNPRTNVLSFRVNSAYGDFLVLNFTGKLNPDTLNGSITFESLDSGEITLKQTVILIKRKNI